MLQPDLSSNHEQERMLNSACDIYYNVPVHGFSQGWNAICFTNKHHTTNQGKKTKLICSHRLQRMKDNRLGKEVMFGTMEGESRRGRPCREWLDDIKGLGEKLTYSTERHRKKERCGRHWTPTSAEPTEQ